MANHFNVLRIRRNLGVSTYGPPLEFVPGQWHFKSKQTTVIVSSFQFITPGEGDTEIEWIHASISHQHKLPTYNELAMLHAAVFENGWAYQVFAPPDRHINIHEYALHLWGRFDGKSQLPDFQKLSGINSV